MSNIVKDIDLKNRTNCFSNDMINVKNFDVNNIKIDENLYKNILIYYIGWICDNQGFEYVKIYSVSPLNLIFNKVNGYFEEINGNKKLTLVPTNGRKEKN